MTWLELIVPIVALVIVACLVLPLAHDLQTDLRESVGVVFPD
jgi:hypothetical protein